MVKKGLVAEEIAMNSVTLLKISSRKNMQNRKVAVRQKHAQP